MLRITKNGVIFDVLQIQCVVPQKDGNYKVTMKSNEWFIITSIDYQEIKLNIFSAGS